MSAAEPLVSIVLPTYNGAKYLEQSLDSCLAQTYRNWELILVDDCSKDDTPNIARRYAERDARIRVLRNDPNRKLPGSLNRGFSEARGELFTWTSDDNAYRPEALARMVEAIQSNPGTGLIYADYTEIDGDGKVIRSVRMGEPEELLFWSVVGACFLYRREVHEAAGGYDEGLFCAEDWDFWLRASNRFTLRHLPEDLYLYRVHGGSLTATRLHQAIAGAETALNRNLRRATNVRAPLRARAYFHMGRMAWRRRSGWSVAKHLFNAMRASPVTFAREITGLAMRKSKVAASNVIRP